MKMPLPLAANVADTLDAIVLASQRMPVVKGPAESRRLPDWLRDAILRRDRFLCRWCGHRAGGEFLHIDHIVPWSAGGTNESTNLRVLCSTCNETRSNTYTDARSARALPVSECCHNCLHTRPVDEPHEHAFCMTCGRTTQVPRALIERSLRAQKESTA